MAFAAGVLSLALAATAQSLLPYVDGAGRGALFLNALRSALTEEGARFLALLLLFAFVSPFKQAGGDGSMNAVAGLVAALAFASLETASLAAANPLAAPVRLVSAAVLHAACGIRCAAAAASALSLRLSGVYAFVVAISLHTVYECMTPRGGFYTVFAILLAATSFITGLSCIKRVPEE
jgi:hypothetical protein